jgi:predicted short-subunit dehydrogenase-like oxidoreductase (DUF2520 family)
MLKSEANATHPGTFRFMKESRQKTSRISANNKGFPVSIIGAGRMGTTLGRALQQLGYSIELVVTRHSTSARRAARLFETKGTTIEQLNRSALVRERLLNSSFLLISTPDDALESVASQLAAILKSPKSKTRKHPRIAMHTSGAISSDVLKPMRAAGFAVASLHPLVSIADAKSKQAAFRNAYFCVEGDGQATRLARTIVQKLGGHSFRVEAKYKALYHAAAVMTSGHVTALFDLAIEMLKRCGLSERRARQVLLPLLESTATNLVSRSAAQALTGPFARGDVKTAEMHLAALKLAGPEAALAAYVILGRRSLDLAGTAQADFPTLDEVFRSPTLSQK